MRSEIGDNTRPRPPLAVAHGEERESRPGKREREEARRGEREERGPTERERDRRRLGLSCLLESLQSFALEFLMRGKGGGGLYL
ncbi:hypothetical protein F2Q69_00004689 [Brassica cretica]|uniref:Uncharacterized protein n=1 Tax=Brassica cretica TaxID=69181 RepID=A0A8S9PFZ7_BRACR|nr:hypothetical protein F2Q69_00004689 [Brassica cretica]